MIKVKVYNSSINCLPKYETFGATGMDIAASNAVVIPAGETKIVPTGLYMEIPEGYEILVFPRSGVSLKTGLRIANSVGKIDSDYRNELGIIIWNASNLDYMINVGERIAQITLYQPPKFEWESVPSREYLSKTNRTGGFGSTGK